MPCGRHGCGRHGMPCGRHGCGRHGMPCGRHGCGRHGMGLQMLVDHELISAGHVCVCADHDTTVSVIVSVFVFLCC